MRTTDPNWLWKYSSAHIVLVGGNGKWGQAYQKTLKELNIKFKIADRSDWKSLIDDTTCAAVIVCTPPESHIEVATYALERNIPTMIEKPLALSLEQALALKQFDHIPILVNHVHLFSEGYQNIKKFCDGHKILSINTRGFNTSPSRSYSSLWDSGVHDISMILDLMNEMPSEIDVFGSTNAGSDWHTVNMRFGDVFAHSSICSNCGFKAREIALISNGMELFYDDTKRPENHTPPLQNAISVFLDSIFGERDYRIGLDLSFKILKVLESCQQSLDIKA